MNSFSKLYLLHTTVFISLAVACFIQDFSWIETLCPTEAAESTSFSSLTNALGYIYLTNGALALIVCGLSSYFSKGYLPPELGQLKRSLSIVGACERISWLLLRITHLILYPIVFGFTIKALSAAQCI